MIDLGWFNPRRGGPWRERHDAAEEAEDERQVRLDAEIAVAKAERRAWLAAWGAANLEPRPDAAELAAKARRERRPPGGWGMVSEINRT